ncbi:GntR family transcriptional regulator [Luteococcus sp.]|uniref:GntR family transcriptional regulator n=1 Tax=Luteococcus sp. TaxID=1969402 RepID=UPI0037358528
MTLPIALDEHDPTPPFEQLRRQIAHAITTGSLVHGSKLPPVRQLAGDLGVAPGTVARAYKELEAAGFVSTARRAGTTVIGRPQVDPGSALTTLTKTFVARARQLGADERAIREALDQALGH